MITIDKIKVKDVDIHGISTVRSVYLPADSNSSAQEISCLTFRQEDGSGFFEPATVKVFLKPDAVEHLYNAVVSLRAEKAKTERRAR